MKKIVLFLMIVLCLTSYSQNNYMTSKDTLYTKYSCYLSEVSSTDAGVLLTSTWEELLETNLAKIVPKNTKLYSIGIGHQVNKKYYDSYVVEYRNKLYYVNSVCVLNINVYKRNYYNAINNKIYNDSVNYEKHIKDSLILSKQRIDSIIKEKHFNDSIFQFKRKKDFDSLVFLVKDSIRKDSIVKYNKWYNTLTIKQKIAYNTINIGECYIDINSACGVSPTINYTNLSNKTIKYFIWYGYIKNNVNDIVYCTIRNRSVTSGKSTGPIKYNETDYCEWDCLWYNCSATKFILNKIEIIYMDKSIITLDTQQINFLLNTNKTKLNKYDF